MSLKSSNPTPRGGEGTKKAGGPSEGCQEKTASERLPLVVVDLLWGRDLLARGRSPAGVLAPKLGGAGRGVEAGSLVDLLAEELPASLLKLYC